MLAAAAASTAIGLIAWVSWPPRRSALASEGDAGTRIVPWCAAGLEAIDGEGCFARPAALAAPVTLVVYLHGRYADAPEELERQARVAKLATGRGFAVLAMRGTRGECAAPGLADYYCWPSNERNATDGPAFVSGFDTAIQAARARLGPGPNVLFGFSNGGYFAALITTHGLATFDAVAIAHGGPVEPTLAADDMPPILLVTSEDAADPEMRKLDGELTLARWPHALVARAGGHSLPDWDIDVAVTFFARVLAGEGLPLDPPLPGHATSAPSVRDAGAEVGADGGDELRDL